MDFWHTVGAVMVAQVAWALIVLVMKGLTASVKESRQGS